MRRRPSSHYRVVKTKTGSRRITINPHIKKRGTIRRSERRIFNNLSTPTNKIEYGGKLDFNREGRLERFTTEIGGEDEVTIPDYEAQWHTHPDSHLNPPSPDDVVSLLKNKNQQAEVIFNNRRVIILNKDEKAKATAKLPDKTLYKRYDQLFAKSITGKHQFNLEGYANALRRDGLHVTLKKPGDNDVSIPLRVVE